jgi:hypothetical protein
MYKEQNRVRKRFFSFLSLPTLHFTIIFSLLIFVASILSVMMPYIPQLQQQKAMAQQQTTSPSPLPSQTNVTTTEANNFLTYDNATLGYRIEYPSNWEQFEQWNSIRFISPFQSSSDRYREIVSVALEPFDNVSMAEWIRNTTNFLNTTSNDFMLSASSPTTLAGFPAHMLEYTYSDPSFGITRTMVISTIPDNQNVYSITYFAKPAEFDNSLPIVQKMINSFQLYSSPS